MPDFSRFQGQGTPVFSRFQGQGMCKFTRFQSENKISGENLCKSSAPKNFYHKQRERFAPNTMSYKPNNKSHLHIMPSVNAHLTCYVEIQMSDIPEIQSDPMPPPRSQQS